MAADSSLQTTQYSGSQRKGANVADALFEIADALKAVAHEIKFLGNGNASTPMGAIEAYGDHIGKKLDSIAAAISDRTD